MAKTATPAARGALRERSMYWILLRDWVSMQL
jgi:hypothetical protein